MKHRISRSIVTFVMTLVLLCSLIPQRAEAAGASLSGESSVRAGESVTLTLGLSGINAYGFSAKLSYSNNLSLTNYNCSVSGWSLEANGGNFSAYGTSPSSGSAVLTVTFKVSSDAKADDSLTASFSGITATDGNNDSELGTASWSGKVGAALSDNANLSSLSCSNATLSPSFSGSTTYYSTTVPFSVSSLNLSYKTADGGAKVSVSGNSLSVGSNTVTVTVKAAKGNTKNYTISVTRQQDPNYKPSTDAALSKLTLDAAQLSPAFNPTVTEYIAYVPFETREVTLSGVAKDEKALGVTEKTVKLTEEGATPVAITCTAEDGTTCETYTVQVFRMPAYEGVLPTVTVEPACTCGAAEDATPSEHAKTCPRYEEPVIPTLDIPLRTTLPLVGECSTLLAAGIGAGIAVLLLIALGFLLGHLTGGRHEEYEESEYPDEVPAKRPAAVQAVPVTDEPTPQKIGFDIEEIPLRRGAEPSELPEEKSSPAEERFAQATDLAEEDNERLADEHAKSMSLDELLNDIHNM